MEPSSARPGEPAAYRIVGVTEETAQAFYDVDRAAFFFSEPPPPQQAMQSLDLSRCFAATRSGAPPFAGIYGSYDLTVTVPTPGGGLRPVPMAGLTWVGVHPDERRRGVLSQMVRHHFEDLHRRGVALSGLHASEPAIYGRFGYAVASLDAFLGLSRGQQLRAPGVDPVGAGVATRLVAFDAEGVAEQVHGLHVRLVGAQLGAVVRPETMTRALSEDYLPFRRGAEPTQVLLAERDGTPVGYALLQRSSKWEDGGPKGSVVCQELAAADPPALLALARRLVDFDLTTQVTLEGRSLDDPVLWWAGGPRAASVKVYDGMWLRLVDAAAALAGRGYAAALDLVLDVEDPVCPWNAGRWRLRCADPTEAATCERTESAADVRLPVQALASAYVGLRSIAAQADAAVVEELTPGAVSALSRAMATATRPAAAVPF